jgi:NADPH:quinone reductase-like Zn-dependent oxidoreductase
VEVPEAKKLTVAVAATYPLKDAAVAKVALKNGEKGPGKIVLEVN